MNRVSRDSELIHVFRITPRIQNYSAYSLFTRASRKASPERLTFRPPVGVLSAYHALILVSCPSVRSSVRSFVRPSVPLSGV